MKKLWLILFLFAASKVFAQSSETLTEERSSAWIKVTTPSGRTASSVVVKKKTTTGKKPPAKKEEESFDKTNQQVNRFKKKN